MANTFYMEIVTPERTFFAGKALSLVLPALDGQRGVMAGHEPMVTAVESGVLKYRTEDGQWNFAAVSRGFAEIMPQYVILLVSTAEHPSEIDEKRARQAMERAEHRLHTSGAGQGPVTGQSRAKKPKMSSSGVPGGVPRCPFEKHLDGSPLHGGILSTSGYPQRRRDGAIYEEERL